GRRQESEMGEIISCPRCKRRCDHTPEETSEETFGTEPPTLPIDAPVPEATIESQIAAKKRGRLRQWLACISATISMIAVGTVYGWITTSLSRLISGENMPLKLTDDEGSWLISLTIIGSMIGPFVGASLADRYGRSLCLIACSGFFILGWLIVLLATNVAALYASRVILGIGVGIAYTTNPMYISEVADTEIRGALGTLTAVNVFTGSLFTCSIGPWVSYATLASILLILPMVFVAIFIWFPESPHYLTAVGRKKEAYKSIAYFKGTTNRSALNRELQFIYKIIDKDSSLKSNRSTEMNRQSWLGRLRLMKQPCNVRALCIIIGLTAAQQFSGNFSTMQYLEVLFTKAKTIDSNIATIIVLSLGLISGTIATATVEKAGRRCLLMISTLGSSVMLLMISGYFGFIATYGDVSGIDFVPIVIVILFQIAYQVGLGTLTNALLGELFPTEAKSIAGAIVMISDGIFGIIVTKLYQVITDNKGPHWMYLIFAICCVIAFFMVLLFVPETKGKNYQEIRALLIRPKAERENAQVENSGSRNEERRVEINGDEERNVIVNVAHEEESPEGNIGKRKKK
ncbi:unnamed protein product, partial [Heterotrigona itama]